MKMVRNALRLNSATCLLFGVLFLVVPTTISTFLGAVSVLVLQIIGGGLVLNGIHLIIASQRANVLNAEVFYFVSTDIIWFAASAFVLANGSFITTRGGVFVTLVVATVVAVIGQRQLWTFAEATKSGVASDGERAGYFLPSDLTRGQAIGTSWLGIKTWVKIWLFGLNVVFLGGLLFWPEPLIKYSIAAFAVSGPLLVAFMTMQRGLTRLLGLAHLIPWLPLLGYLGLRLVSDVAGPQITMSAGAGLFFYVWVLFFAVGICLAFDVYDVVRWARGKRERLGSLFTVNNP